MFALNSYGIQRASNQNGGGVSLPPLSIGSPVTKPHPQFHSLGKLEVLRNHGHPLFRTTTKYEYGRYLDFQDVAHSCPKHGKRIEFTKTFIDGPFADTSLTSIDKSKLRMESWQKKVSERTRRMKEKHEELQQILNARKEARRLAREERRREMEKQQLAATAVQAFIRGHQLRQRLQTELSEQQHAAARIIQQTCQSYVKMRKARAELLALKHKRLEGFARKVQSATRLFLQRIDAQRELQRRREERRCQQIERERRVEELRNAAAREIQRMVRQHRTRRMQHQTSTVSTTAEKEEKDTSSKARQSSRNRITAHKALASLRRKQRSQHRISLSTLPK